MTSPVGIRVQFFSLQSGIMAVTILCFCGVKSDHIRTRRWSRGEHAYSYRVMPSRQPSLRRLQPLLYITLTLNIISESYTSSALILRRPKPFFVPGYKHAGPSRALLPLYCAAPLFATQRSRNTQTSATCAQSINKRLLKVCTIRN